MFWDRVAKIYDFNETLFNGKVNRQLCLTIASLIDKDDRILECACGTGMLSKAIGETCRELTATDFSDKMLAQARKKCKGLDHIVFETGNILNLKYPDHSFHKVIAGNVIHLLDYPEQALRELERVCKAGGKILIPTYLTGDVRKREQCVIGIYNKLGADFKRRFTFETYQEFFRKAGYDKIAFTLIDGKMPCALAIIEKETGKRIK